MIKQRKNPVFQPQILSNFYITGQPATFRNSSLVILKFKLTIQKKATNFLKYIVHKCESYRQ